ncbi:MAG: lipoyl(octanoyl) transferase LipB [Deltaproteobacteria bacterium]|nr:lipoyl(octanoyl) transferase LipB [Deltaproteobacteria bacterium]
MEILLHRDLGREEFLTAFSFQEKLAEEKRNGKLADILLLVEHPHVFTIGRGGKDSNVIRPGEVPVLRTNRGGDVTYHGPGQMVTYPVIDLNSRLRRDVHRYLRLLERTVIETLLEFGIHAASMPPWTGIWIQKRKIASIGIAVKRGIAYHGLALNVNTDLSYFERIIPCGLLWAEMTSVQKELGRIVRMEEVKKKFVGHFMRIFGYSELRELCHEGTLIGSKLEPQAVPTISA